jgi:hypothetical protein
MILTEVTPTMAQLRRKKFNNIGPWACTVKKLYYAIYDQDGES